MDETFALRLLQAVCFVWLGLIAGISLLEAPVKFTAPSVTREIGLDVGRHVFAALNWTELGLAALAGALCIVAWPEGTLRWVLGGIGVVLLLQTVWLLPELLSQATAIVEGTIDEANTWFHLGYIALEAIKLIALGTAGWLLGAYIS